MSAHTKNSAPTEKKLSEAAKRALKEANERRDAIDTRAKRGQDEVAGRGGLEPTRYDDWEIKGITSDF